MLFKVTPQNTFPHGLSLTCSCACSPDLTLSRSVTSGCAHPHPVTSIARRFRAEATEPAQTARRNTHQLRRSNAHPPEEFPKNSLQVIPVKQPALGDLVVPRGCLEIAAYN